MVLDTIGLSNTRLEESSAVDCFPIQGRRYTPSFHSFNNFLRCLENRHNINMTFTSCLHHVAIFQNKEMVAN